MLDKNGIEYITIDITENQEAYDKVVAMGFRSAPVVISGDQSWSGFQPDKINSL
jgi:glutaredoxin-like protein NrdH